MAIVRKPAPAGRRPVPAAKASPRSARKAQAPAKAAPVAKRAAPARPVSEAKTSQLAAARAVRSEKAAAAKAAPTEVHPVRKEEIQMLDVLRSLHTFFTLYSGWIQQQGEEITEVLEFVAPIMPTTAGAPKKSPLTRAKVEPEDRTIGEYYDMDVVKKYTITELRALAADLAEQGLITETKVKPRILEQMEAAGLFREEGSAAADEDDIEDDVDEGDEEDVEEEDDEEESDSDDDADEAEDAVYERADLKGMTLKQLQELAEANEYDWKGLGKAELIDALLADEEEDDEDEEDGEEEEDVVPIDPDELPSMDLAELLELADQIDGLKIPAAKRKNKKAVIQLILDELGEDEDE